MRARVPVHERDVRLLQQTAGEEGRPDRLLVALAESVIDVHALRA